MGLNCRFSVTPAGEEVTELERDPRDTTVYQSEQQIIRICTDGCLKCYSCRTIQTMLELIFKSSFVTWTLGRLPTDEHF